MTAFIRTDHGVIGVSTIVRSDFTTYLFRDQIVLSVSLVIPACSSCLACRLNFVIERPWRYLCFSHLRQSGKGIPVVLHRRFEIVLGELILWCCSRFCFP
jgi:hypothetical protein